MRYRICLFCGGWMEQVKEGANKDFFDLYKCFDCQLSKGYKTMYRQLYDIGDTPLLSDAIELEDFYIIRYFSPGTIKRKYNYSVINHDIVGYFRDDIDFEPITYRVEVCELDHIIELPLHDPELALKKLRVYTTFS